MFTIADMIKRTFDNRHDKEKPLFRGSLYGPEAGDSPIDNSDVTLEVRGHRKGPSRLIDKPHRPARRVAVIGIRGGWFFTMYGT